MHNAVFSINPVYVERIYSGEKRYEFRKKCCKRAISRILIYETAPISKIVGEVAVLDIITADPAQLWETTQYAAGISKSAFDQYFRNKSEGVAYSLGSPVLYSSPILLQTIGISAPPQSYCYISQEIYEEKVVLQANKRT